MAAGTQDNPLKGGHVKNSLQADLRVRLPSTIPQKNKYDAVVVSNRKYSITHQVLGPGGNGSAPKGPVNQYQAHGAPAATVTTTAAVAYTANIGVTRRPRWSHRSKATTKIHQATPGFPRPRSGGESPRVLPWAHHVHIHDADQEL